MEEAETPITLSDKAAAEVLKLRTAEKIPDDQVLRIGIRGGGCSGFTYDLSFGEVKPDVDRLFTIKGVTVDEMSLMYVVGTELDFVDGLNGSGFKFNNPNVKSTCGCGSSFST